MSRSRRPSHCGTVTEIVTVGSLRFKFAGPGTGGDFGRRRARGAGPRQEALLRLAHGYSTPLCEPRHYGGSYRYHSMAHDASLASRLKGAALERGCPSHQPGCLVLASDPAHACPVSSLINASKQGRLRSGGDLIRPCFESDQRLLMGVRGRPSKPRRPRRIQLVKLQAPAQPPGPVYSQPAAAAVTASRARVFAAGSGGGHSLSGPCIRSRRRRRSRLASRTASTCSTLTASDCKHLQYINSLGLQALAVH